MWNSMNTAYQASIGLGFMAGCFGGSLMSFSGVQHLYNLPKVNCSFSNEYVIRLTYSHGSMGLFLLKHQ